MKIRKALENDLNKVIEFERNYMLEHEAEHIKDWDAIIDETTATLKSSLNKMFVVESENSLVAFAYWSIEEGEPCVMSIYVKSTSRRQGLAGLLLTSLEEDIRSKGYSTVTLQTLLKNPAQKVFEASGYERLDIKNNYIQYRKKLD